jgi:hypothetical protein
MSSSQIDYSPRERQRWFTDEDGARATSKRLDETIEVTIDWSDIIDGDIVASVAYSDSGVTRSLTSNTTSRTTTSVTGLGEFEVTVTLSSGRIAQQVRRFYDSAGGSGARDYR